MVAEEVWEMKRKEVEAFGYFNDLKLLDYALILTRMGVKLLNF